MKTLKITIKTLVTGSIFTLLSGCFFAQSNSFDVNFQVTDVDCYGNNNASIEAIVTGGVQPYTYTWSNGASTSGINGLIGGDYNLLITDASGHQEIHTAQINSPEAPLTISANVLNVSEFAGSDGSISVGVAGGTEFKMNNPYNYFWSNGGTTINQSGLVAGLYTLTVVDAHGCVSVGNYTISQPFPTIMNPVLTAYTGGKGVLTKIHPNPSFGSVVTIKWDSEVSKIALISMRGETMLSEDVNNLKSVNLSDIPSGEYLVYYYNNEQLLKTERLSIQ
jgi:hypothetical protein